ncbi:MAG: DNA-directed RNA polymerase subunit D [Candidatus Thermoplasmatota archaeon]|jgi:DNA-directed RNA polymerase subunit D|nr:DNA-directed RNA polymerase subunit D [Euryarchaeota archaeon]MAN00273.1 DNA-directed RNA polymerase subunit D [Euryarchaeota archaeon]MBO53686.1 DNA-directed RNA polymerase subunit D [Euryarchaeota archaeon]MED5452160.1 DNA-directed RNA polymerase subunit D [Candidatus Thermoplasmatota archaeon]|tara:strand:- start:9982 stop:10866 length:885 start_codon:yes stop_codon:yes gene_type:complete
MVKTKIIEESDEKIRILLTDTDRAFVNAIRRTLMSETPKMAIDKVRFEMGTVEQDGEVWETNGPLPDEMIAQRLAMIPIPTVHDEFHFQDKCPECAELVEKDRGCPLCTMIYTCKEFGSDGGRIITAGDMSYLGEDRLNIPEKYRSIPITKLSKGQMVEFYATAIMGRGSEHAKWSPVSGVTFTPRRVGVLNNKTKAKILWGLKLTIKAKDFDGDRLEDLDMVEQLIDDLNHVGPGTEESREFKDAITLEEVPGEFILSFETDGSMTPKVAFEQAIAQLSERFGELEEDIVAVF